MESGEGRVRFVQVAGVEVGTPQSVQQEEVPQDAQGDKPRRNKDKKRQKKRAFDKFCRLEGTIYKIFFLVNKRILCSGSGAVELKELPLEVEPMKETTGSPFATCFYCTVSAEIQTPCHIS